MYALILAGGKGERLKPLTDTVPKPMVKIMGIPIIKHQLDWLSNQGITNVIILCSYKWTIIQNYLGDGENIGLNIKYSVEKTPLGRGGGLRQGLDMVPKDEKSVIALNGDVITNQPIKPLLKLHNDKNATATLMLTRYPSAYGVLELNVSGKVTSFEEKGTLPHWIHAGVDILERSIIDELPKLGDHETTTLPAMAKDGRLYGYKSDASWLTIDGFKDLKLAEEAIQNATRKSTS